MKDLLGASNLFEYQDFIKLCFRLLVDLVFATVIIKFIYAKLHKNHEQIFTFFLLNIITFSLSFLLRKVPIELGFALGLFAVFGILRYRTQPIRLRDLTYLFIVIGLGILNAVANKKISIAELLLVNGVIVGATYLLEYAPFGRREKAKEVLYDKLALLHPGQSQALKEDLRERIGVPVSRVHIESIDLLRDTARVTVFYDANQCGPKKGDCG